jgi:hypothetical protein
MTMIAETYWETISRIVALIAEGRYEDVSRLCDGSRLSAKEMKAAVAMYGRTIVPLPQKAASLISSVRIQKAADPTWSVVVPLFTREEGRSDLSLELMVTESQPGSVAVHVDDLHVL